MKQSKANQPKQSGLRNISHSHPSRKFKALAATNFMFHQSKQQQYLRPILISQLIKFINKKFEMGIYLKKPKILI